MKQLFEKWYAYLKEGEDENGEPEEVDLEEPDHQGDDPTEPDPFILNVSDISDSGFCYYNPLINSYAQESPENLAEMLIFVVSTQQQRWYDVVPKFPILMKYIKENDGLLEPGVDYQEFPQPIKMLILGFRKKAIDSMWRNRETIYSRVMPLISKYNGAKTNSLQKEEAMFEIYLEFLQLYGLALPKAAFASQLIIGRLGCIDSINLNIYKGLDPEGKLLKVDTGNRLTFKRPGTKPAESGLYQITAGGVKLAKRYVEFLQQIATMNQTTEANISRSLWDTWVEIVAKKINLQGDLEIIMPNGEKYKIPNDYSKRMSKDDADLSGKYREKYMGKITGKDVSRQHFPKEMYESLIQVNLMGIIRENLRNKQNEKTV